ncbi:DUF4811 domain-containing protein [Weissella confusa]|uniref:DUF4811 domain-containing protein n=1 Tax=Weissella confusa TaxID=1583 RepID=A0A923NF21_WEICO|nr:DUF4811 domain-containing protein [Weissella confusa]
MPKSSWLAVTEKQAKQLTKLQGAQDTAQQQALQQVVLPIGVLVTKELGTKADNYVLVYADKKDAKATPHFVPDTKHMVQAVKKSATYREANVSQATVTTTTTAVVAILTYLAWIRIEPLAWRVPLGVISGTVFVALVMLLLVNFDRHYGMEKVTKTETHQIYSAVGDNAFGDDQPIAIWG